MQLKVSTSQLTKPPKVKCYKGTPVVKYIIKQYPKIKINSEDIQLNLDLLTDTSLSNLAIRLYAFMLNLTNFTELDISILMNIFKVKKSKIITFI